MANYKVLDAVLRSNFAAFIQKVFNTLTPGARYLDNWHITAIAYHLERCLRGELKRLTHV